VSAVVRRHLAISARGLTKRYGALTAVDGLDLDIPEGQFFGLLGPNGSGKTSTIHMLATLIRPSGGSASVAGQDIGRRPVAVRRAIGLVFQESALDRSLTVQENLALAAALHDLAPALARPRIAELLELFGLADRRATPVGALSGGMRRALDIARGVLHRPGILFLDEPTIGLDLLNRRAIWRHIERLRAEHGMTVLLTTHYLEEAQDCDRVAFLSRGRLVGSGTPRELVGALGARILEVRSATPQALAAELRGRLGAGLIEGDTVSFRVADERFSLERLQEELGARVQGLVLRRPDLNDVYVWLNSAGQSAAGAPLPSIETPAGGALR
jgi:ABC-2 type transport system ATP-binding protein